MATEIIVPTLGESITEATLGQWLKMPGDAVKADEPVASLETDKVAIDVPAPVDGVMGDHLVAPGATVAVGAAIARIESGSGMPAVAQAEHPAPESTPVNPTGAGENVELRAADAPEEAGGSHL
ncbi:MAG TPA: biotin/lipoyl-containing protein, partial [Allosphingosinicella sp.]